VLTRPNTNSVLVSVGKFLPIATGWSQMWPIKEKVMNPRALTSFGLFLGLLSTVCYSQETTIDFNALQSKSWNSPRLNLTEPHVPSELADNSSAEVLGTLGDSR
jgi:hypothetical protein